MDTVYSQCCQSLADLSDQSFTMFQGIQDIRRLELSLVNQQPQSGNRLIGGKPVQFFSSSVSQKTPFHWAILTGATSPDDREKLLRLPARRASRAIGT